MRSKQSLFEIISRIENSRWLAIVFIAAAIFFNFHRVFLLQVGFLTGDDVDQHIPWTHFLAESLKNFQLPFWTAYIHSGFPLLAEGQIGAFYPLNLFFTAILSIHAAFNYSILFHFFLGGVFFYVYARSIGLGRWPAIASTLMFLFGSTQAGLFYNVTSQKVLIWFPLTLYFTDKIIQEEKWGHAGWLGILFALEFFAGYLQIAVYSILMTGLYFLYFAIRRYLKTRDRKRFFSSCFRFVGSLVFTLAVSSPQLVPTFELSHYSPRVGLEEAFAYLGSASPAVFATLFFPGWDGILDCGPGIYLGIVSLFFLIFSLMTRKGEKEKFFIAFFIFTVLLALGKYSPLYVGIVKLTHFYGFRIPAKFLFFSAFSVAILAGYGFEKILKSEREKVETEPALSYKLFSIACGCAIGGMLLANALLRLGKPAIMEWARKYIQAHIYGSSLHPHSLDFYFMKLGTYYQALLEDISPFSYNTLVPIATILVTMLVLGFILKRRISFQRSRYALILLLFMDLFFYGFTSVKYGLRDFSLLYKESQILDFLKMDQGLFRIYELDENPVSSEKNFPVFPNFNMFHNLSDVGAYSPFVMKEYRDLFSNLGGINDSLVALAAKRESLALELPILSRLNVKYILSCSEISDPRLKEILRDRGVILYENQSVLPRAYFVTQFRIAGAGQAISAVREEIAGLPLDQVLLSGEDSGYQPSKRRLFEEVPIERYEQEEVSLRYRAPDAGFLVLSDLDYPGWRVWVNGRERDILKANGLLRAVHLEKGENYILFRYRPSHFVFLTALSTLAVFGFLAGSFTLPWISTRMPRLKKRKMNGIRS